MLKILHICKKFPYPVADGETIAMRALSAPLAATGASLSLLVMNTKKHFFQLTPAGWPDALAHYKEIRAVEIDNRVQLPGAFLNLFSRKSYHIARFESARFSDALETWLQQEQFDVVILETPYLAPYVPVIRRASRAAVVLRAHNIECEIWERYAANLPVGPKRWYIAYLAKKLRRFETAMLNQYDLLLAITARDLSRFREMGFSGKGYVLPVGLDVQQYGCSGEVAQAPRSIGFLGALDWTPNLEGLRWFLQEVWPLIHDEFPEVTLEVAGRNTPEWLLDLHLPGVIVLGAVEDARGSAGDRCRRGTGRLFQSEAAQHHDGCDEDKDRHCQLHRRFGKARQGEDAEGQGNHIAQQQPADRPPVDLAPDAGDHVDRGGHFQQEDRGNDFLGR